MDPYKNMERKIIIIKEINSFITNNTFLAWISIISLAIGIISLYESVKAVKNTQNIQAAIKQTKMKKYFRNQYYDIMQALSLHIAVLKEDKDNVAQNVFTTIYETLKKIDLISNACDWEKKDKVTLACSFCKNNIMDFSRNNILCTELIEHLINIKIIVEGEGVNNDIG